MSDKKDDAAIKVRRQWNDRRRIATYRLGDISELQWGRTSGGVQARTPQPFVHGYVMCDAMIGGKLAHSCSHGPAPHRIKVCLTRKGNESVWKEVLAIVGPSPGRPRRQPGGRTISSPMSLRTTPAAQAQSFPADGNDGKGRATSHECGDVVEVRRQWNDWRIATYRLRDISELRWGWRGGGLKWRTPQPFVHGYVMCDARIGGILGTRARAALRPTGSKCASPRRETSPSGRMLRPSSGRAPSEHADGLPLEDARTSRRLYE